jgi:AcrR family transcriptional regulator
MGQAEGSSNARPAHRPSRRAAVIDAAIDLFARYPAERITVADIADAANMTAAAVYYHFPSKESILLEGLQGFTRAYLAEVGRLLRERDGANWPASLARAVLDWLDGRERRASAAVFFAHSAGLDMTLEALRRETRIELVSLLARSIGATSDRPLSPSEVGVIAIALVSAIETSATSWLTQDLIFQGLGPRRFREETAALAERIVSGTPVRAAADTVA